MEWGDIPPLRTMTIRLLEGDLFVMVVNKYGLQTDNATLYCSVVLRPTSMSLATMQARMDAICQFHNWCGLRGLDFLQRFESGEFFQQHELAALLAPCPSHGACAGCSEHLVVKGKPEHRAEAERLLSEHETMLAQAQAETDEGTFNASVWVAHNEKMVAGLKKTVAVHDNPEIPDGTMVQV